MRNRYIYEEYMQLYSHHCKRYCGWASEILHHQFGMVETPTTGGELMNEHMRIDGHIHGNVKSENKCKNHRICLLDQKKQMVRYLCCSIKLVYETCSEIFRKMHQ